MTTFPELREALTVRLHKIVADPMLCDDYCNAMIEAAETIDAQAAEIERLQGFPDDYTLIPWRIWQEAARKGLSYESLLQQRGMTLRGPSREECPDGPRGAPTLAGRFGLTFPAPRPTHEQTQPPPREPARAPEPQARGRGRERLGREAAR